MSRRPGRRGAQPVLPPRNAFDADAEQAAQPLADYAGEIISTSALYAYAVDLVDGLVESLENQAIIAQATGIL